MKDDNRTINYLSFTSNIITPPKIEKIRHFNILFML